MIFDIKLHKNEASHAREDGSHQAHLQQTSSQRQDCGPELRDRSAVDCTGEEAKNVINHVLGAAKDS